MEWNADQQFRALTTQTCVMKMLNVSELKDPVHVNPQVDDKKKSTAANAGMDIVEMDIHAMVINYLAIFLL